MPQSGERLEDAICITACKRLKDAPLAVDKRSEPEPRILEAPSPFTRQPLRGS